jgi:hypothetical protein
MTPKGDSFINFHRTLNSNPFSWLQRWKVREPHTLTAERLADVLFASPLFTDERRTLILEGISAYYNGDHVKAVHLLVPQIEHAMRILLVSLGIPASKPGAVHPRAFMPWPWVQEGRSKEGTAEMSGVAGAQEIKK